MKVLVVPPDPSWAATYEAGAARLREALKDLNIGIHHIGSTAIRGIFAKPIIDMLLVVQDLESLDAREDDMRSLGYEPMGEFGISDRRYFRRKSSGGVGTHHVHSFKRGSVGALRHLAFRDYMNAHAAAAQDYSALKQRLAAASPDDIQAYMDGKDVFIKQHEALALAWQRSAGYGA